MQGQGWGRAAEEGEKRGAEPAEDAQLAPKGRTGACETVVEPFLERGLFSCGDTFAIACLCEELCQGDRWVRAG